MMASVSVQRLDRHVQLTTQLLGNYINNFWFTGEVIKVIHHLCDYNLNNTLHAIIHIHQQVFDTPRIIIEDHSMYLHKNTYSYVHMYSLDTCCTSISIYTHSNHHW